MAKPETPDIYVMRSGDVLIGEYAQDREWIAALPRNERIRVTLRTGRSPRKLRWYWSYLGKVVSATGCTPTTEALHSLVKMETGHTTPIIYRGLHVNVPASIAFDRMTEQEFNVFLESAIEYISRTFGITPEMAFGEEEIA